MAKFIFTTGGVVSSVGKGVSAAAIGRLLKERGYKVAVLKLDPYINVDPGTMSPYQHGEVYVLDDGSETDLDLGHYERFMDIRLTSASSATAGQIYAEVIGKERRGDYLGGTIQVIPHITNEIKHRIVNVAQVTGAEIVLVEVGGTVGDIEGLPFLEALRQFRSDFGRENTLYIHVTWLTYIGATGELKTKPTQHSVRELRSIGISPDVIIARSDHPVEPSICEKIAQFCDVEKQAVIPLVTSQILYEIPLLLEYQGIANFILNRLNLEESKQADLSDWRHLVDLVKKPKSKVTVGLVGKYVELHDAYMSVRESLKHAALHLGIDLDLRWIHSSKLEEDDAHEQLTGLHGIIVPGGFGVRGIEGKINAVRYARETKTPFFGLCLGMQCMMIDAGRQVLGDPDANSTEFDPQTLNPIIDLMADQTGLNDMGGTMRLGLYPCVLEPGSLAAKAYKAEIIQERHRHRYEFNNLYRQLFEENGIIFSGLSPDGTLVEIAEYRDHPFMLGVQYHPEFLSRPNRPHPLFTKFIEEASKRAGVSYIAPET